MTLARNSTPRGAIILMTGECNGTPATMLNADEVAQLRAKLEASGEVRTFTPTRLRDGTEAFEAEQVVGGQITNHMLIVPCGDTALLAVYMVPSEEGDPINWATIKAGIKFDKQGIPMWVWAVGGGLIVLLLLVKLASGGPKPTLGSVNFQKGAFGDSPTWGSGGSTPGAPGTPGTISRPAFGGGDAQPASRPMGAPGATAPGTTPPRSVPAGTTPPGARPAGTGGAAPGTGATAPGVPTPPARAPEAVKQIPGLRSTLPPSGEWSKR